MWMYSVEAENRFANEKKKKKLQTFVHRNFLLFLFMKLNKKIASNENWTR